MAPHSTTTVRCHSNSRRRKRRRRRSSRPHGGGHVGQTSLLPARYADGTQTVFTLHSFVNRIYL